ncbi:hypothetical protein [Pseudomonas sp. Z2-11]
MDELLKRLSTLSEGLVGDPGWEFEYVKDEGGGEYYSFSADYEFSGIEPSHKNYSVAVVREAIKDSLLALASKNQAKVVEVAELIRKYKFDCA